MVREKTNKLSIFLIRKEYTSFEEIVDSEKKFEKIELDPNTLFYYSKSFLIVPSWVKNFFNNKLDSVKDLKLASTQGLLLIKTKVNKKTDRIFAIAFGRGRFLLKKKCSEERFGLRSVLNVINSDSIRRIDKKDISSIPKHSIEQRSKVGSRLDFGINIEQELIQGVTGLVKKSLAPTFGKSVAGSDSLNLSVKNNISNICDFLVDCYKIYQKNNYKSDFGWIDQIKPIRNKDLIDKLNSKLINEIKKKDSSTNIWMAVPEVIEWERVEGFSYSDSTDDLKDDIFLNSFLGTFSPKEKMDIDIEFLKSKHIYSFDSNKEELYKWAAYECIYGEIKQGTKTYLLSNGDWFEIENSFVKEINRFYATFLSKESNLSITLPVCNVKNEGEYNKLVAEEQNVCLMDKKTISYGGGHSSIEFCDLLTKKNEFIHIKKYGGSSVLSYLFNQGLISGELIKIETPFIKKVNEKLPKEYRLPDSINARDYKIIFVIISKIDKDLSIPFFSKIALKNIAKRLEALGYEVYLERVKQTYREDE